MRKVILQMMITLDGLVSGPNGEVDWVDNDPEMGQDHYALAENADLALMGYTLYEGMASYWPEAAANPKSVASEAAFATLMNQMPKLVFATNDETLGWTNATLCRIKDSADMAQKVRHLKAESGGYLLVYGGIQTAQTLIEHGLIDEFQLALCPVALGIGSPLFTGHLNLDLVSVKQYKSGALTLVYRPIRDVTDLA